MKTVVVSDIHLGSKYSEVELFLDFLKKEDFDCLILNGDFLDLWRISAKKNKRWGNEENTAIQKILRIARKGTKVIYILGNHDDGLNQYINEDFGNIEIKKEHVESDILIFHGDTLDFFVTHRWISKLGDHIYCHLVGLTYAIKKKFPGKKHKHFSLSKFLKSKTKKVTNYINSFEESAILLAKEKNFRTVITGHIHHAEDRNIDGVRYLNSGCWTVDGECNYIEIEDGQISLKKWKK